jgi:hypothetical protein
MPSYPEISTLTRNPLESEGTQKTKGPLGSGPFVDVSTSYYLINV